MKTIICMTLFTLCMIVTCKSQEKVYSLEFDTEDYTIKTFTLDNVEYRVRAYENIIYVQNPIDTNCQKMNIYIPEAYYIDQTINQYNKRSAPILFPNGIGGDRKSVV